MDVPMTEQCIQFVYALLLGLFFGVRYLLFRSCGRRAHALLWDAVFVTVSLTAGTVFFMTVCRGYPRVFHLLGFALGAALIRLLFHCAGRMRRSGRRTNEKEKIPSDP